MNNICCNIIANLRIANVVFLVVIFLVGCGDSKQANQQWEKTKQLNTKIGYKTFSEEHPKHSKAEESAKLAKDFIITLVDKASATLDREEFEGKTLTFLFVDVTAQWPNVEGSGKVEDIYGTFKENAKSTLQAVVHWSWKNVELDMKGRMGHMNGGSFINTEPLKKYPGHPTKFPSEEGWYIYKFDTGSTARLGLFFEGKANEMKTLNIFGQSLDVSNFVSVQPATNVSADEYLKRTEGIFSFTTPASWRKMPKNEMRVFKQQYEQQSEELFKSYHGKKEDYTPGVPFIVGYTAPNKMATFVLLVMKIPGQSKDYLDEIYKRSEDVIEWGISQGQVNKSFSNKLTKISNTPALETDLEMRNGSRMVNYSIYSLDHPDQVIQITLLFSPGSYGSQSAAREKILKSLHVDFSENKQ